MGFPCYKVYEKHEFDNGTVSVGIPLGKMDLIREWKKENCEDIRFYQMVKKYIEFMEENDEVEKFIFEGDY